MPFYDLKCDKCGKEFNIMARMSERENRQIKCPDCGCNELSTVYKSVNIIQSKKPDAPACPNAHKCGCSCMHN